MNALEIHDLTKRYDGFALSGLELTLPQGCVMGLVGENGAGKSTVIRLILNMIRADGGTVSVLGRSNQEDLALTKEDLGVVPDEVSFPDCLTARQVGKIMAHTYRNWDGTAYGDYLKKLDVPEDKAFRAFSRGTKMKLGIAVALSHGAKLLLLDEATNGLDPVAREAVMEILYDFTRDEERSVLISSHIVSDLEKICDYIAFLHRGRLLLCREKDELLAAYGLLQCPAARLEELPPEAVLWRRVTAYGAQALVRRREVPRGTEVSPVSLEDIFVAMIKEERV